MPCVNHNRHIAQPTPTPLPICRTIPQSRLLRYWHTGCDQPDTTQAPRTIPACHKTWKVRRAVYGDFSAHETQSNDLILVSSGTSGNATPWT